MNGQELMGINPLLADRVRLSILVTLVSANKSVAFNDLLASLGVTKGNLSAHLRKLENEDFILVNKQFSGRKPLTTYKCSAKGKKELEKYLATMNNLISNLGKSRA